MAANFLVTQSERLGEVVSEALLKFRTITAGQWNEKPSNGGWSKKEILGHLIDSAANNHLRFVRAQIAEKEFVSFAYEQNFFVTSQKYQDREPEEVILFWQTYNRHLAHVIANMNRTKLSVICKVGHYDPVTLEFLVKDYIDHMEHHLTRILA